MNGKGVAWFQPPSAFGSEGVSLALEVSLVDLVMLEEYQPRRVLISVLFIPAARTLMRTSPGPGVGSGTSV
jgi:hypothetical protein